MADVFSVTRAEIEQALAVLAGSGEAPELARPGAAAILFAGEPPHVLWASPAAEPAAAALVVDAAGLVASSLPARDRLAALARGLAPRRGSRLEKLRFETSAFAPLATCAVRLVALPGGGEALLTVFVDGPPRLRARPVPAAVEAASSEPEPLVREPLVQDAHAQESPVEQAAAPGASGGAQGDGPQHAAPQHAAPQHDAPQDVAAQDAAPAAPDGPPADIRFLWEADASGRFTRVTEGLAEAVGPASADIVGRTFAELLAERVHDPKDIVAELLARGETFSGRTLHWRVDGADEAVAVDFAGLPVRDRERGLAGYRGFGLCRMSARAPWLRPAPAVAAPPSAPAPAIAPAPLVPEPAPVAASPAPEPHPQTPGGEAAQASAAPEAPIAASEPAAPARRPESSLDFGSWTARVGATLGAPPPTALRVVAADEPSEVEATEAVEPADAPQAVAESQAAVEIQGAQAESSQAEASSTDSTEPAAAEPAREPAGGLTAAERDAFREIAQALGAKSPAAPVATAVSAPPVSVAGDDAADPDDGAPPATVILAPANDLGPDTRAVLDRMPAGVAVHRGERAIFVNRYLLDLLGYPDLDAFQRDGGLARMLRGRPGALAGAVDEATAPLSVATRDGGSVAVEVRLTTVEWAGAPAAMLMVRKVPEADPAQRLRAMELDLRAREESLREQAAILDTATDGVALLDQNGRILSLNRAAEALFGYDQREIAGEPFTLLLQTESHVAALGYLDAMRGEGLGALLNDGRDVLGRERQGGAIPLFMTLGVIGEGLERKFCVVLRDMTAFKQAEGELVAARRAAERASAQKSDFLAKISHEIRTPLNAIIGFAEVMLEERFGPVGNERYRDYIADIHASGAHVISLVNDLLDLAKIEAGRMELSFEAVNLNELAASGVALMQPQAARDRIVLRTSFGERVPPVLADARSLRQIVLNLLSNAVKFSEPGGQVIVSTAVSETGDVVFRVRDTGIGMNEAEIEAALEPFRQLATSRRGGGTGLGLPLTKALVEANRGSLKISSRRDEGTLVEVALPRIQPALR